ncbi:MAG TPA: PSD1 and planctomycete cytochrome C domain-containing protein [Vicinamibacterales bacterium]|nr:PSD1 and planctomycete cytochrome C domain-containing protein [Vicinamibacterales bacterium]
MRAAHFRRRPLSWSLAMLAFTLMPAAPALAQDDERAGHVYEIFRNRCFACHGEVREAGLDLRTAASLTAGSSNGPVVIAHQPQRSRLFLLVSHQQQPAMPAAGARLSDEDVETIRQWIEEGGSLESVDEAMGATGRSDLTRYEERPITAEERQFWAFRPPRRAAVPAVRDARWRRHPIDAFLYASLRAKRLAPSPRADRRALIRRAYLDLLGLPPTPVEVDAFVKDASPDAWPRLIDRLLASPHYGERWARHWLDLVRYADSGGFEFDVDRPQAWRYRDYVVNAFNSDKPYDQFIREQIAGDEYTASDEAMIATGFLRLGPEGGGGGERGRQDALDDIVATTTLTFMGMTVSCARCHNHKFDPIPQKDYYRIQSVFYPTRRVEHPLVPSHVVSAHRAETAGLEALKKPLQARKTAVEAPYLKQLVDASVAELPEYLQIAWRTPDSERTEGQRLNVAQIEKTLTDDTLRARITEKDIVALMTPDDRQQHEALKGEIEALDKQRPAPYATARAIGEAGREPPPSFFLLRGSIDAKGSRMAPGILTVAHDGDGDYAFPEPPPDAASSWRRRGFAEWLVSPDNPLTARVMVNRLWQHHFGEGIVRTPSNFGQLGDRPSHPELLDWLAVEFIDRGWSLKAMHRLMMTSEAYQMASRDISANFTIDPDNRFVWRMARPRLEAEIIRDQILAVAGTLDRTLGGPNVYPYIDPDLFEVSSRRNWPGKPDDDPSTWRRSLYVFSKRSIRYPLFEAFDQPNLINSVDRRNRSTVAPQALLLMNNASVLFQATKFAERVQREAGDDAGAQVTAAFRLALGRDPDDVERAASTNFIRESAGGLAAFCHALFNLNEFVYRP